MMPLLRSLTIAGLGVLSAAADGPTRGIDIELIAEAPSIQAGQPFQLALAIHHHDDFHTYWENPGVVGMATAIQWALPDGFKASPLQWPAPEIVDMSGHPAHGYTRDVLLITQITPPKTLSETRYTLGGKASWMACAASCHPGNKELSITLPVQAEPASHGPHQSRFQAARDDIPQPLEDWSGSWSSDPAHTRINLHLNPPASEGTIESAYFFSTDRQISSDGPQSLKCLPDGTLELRIQRSEFSPPFQKTLPGVLQLTRADGTMLTGTITLKIDERAASPAP